MRQAVALVTLVLAVLAGAGLARARTPIVWPSGEQQRFSGSLGTSSDGQPARRYLTSRHRATRTTRGPADGYVRAAATNAQPRFSSAIIFPDHEDYIAAGDVVPECDHQPFQALDPNTGLCQSLMVRGNCSEGFWFILERGSEEAGCRRQPCPTGEAVHDGGCRRLNDTSVCAQDMSLLMAEYGDAECDCDAGAVWWEPERRCYPALMRGPCGPGQLLNVSEAGLVVCQTNPCRDGSVVWPATGTCFRLWDDNNSPCAAGRMEVDPGTLQVQCATLAPNFVFMTQRLNCAPGSMRAAGNRCRRSLSQDSSGGAATRSTQKCPSGFTEDRSGNCRRSSGGLG